MIVDLHAETVGTGPAVLLVHGMGDDASGWAAAVAGLKDEFACTTIDLPGHGRSPAPAERAAYERESVLASMDAALTRDGAAPGGAVFVGHSLGGYLGLAHCLTRPGVIRGFVTPVASSATDDATNGSS